MAALDGTSLSVALPVSVHKNARKPSSNLAQDIAQELNGTAIEAFWSGTSFLLCSTGGFNCDTADVEDAYIPLAQFSNPALHHFPTSSVVDLWS
jgi:hypothetical protein